MYRGTTQAFNEAITRDGRTFQARMTREGEELSGFFSIKLMTQANEGTDTISVGGAVSSYVEVSMEKPAGTVAGKEYLLEIALLVDGREEWVPMGLFMPQAPKEKDGILTFTAYDRMMSRMETPYFSKITQYPADGREILKEICTVAGIPVDTADLQAGVMAPMRTAVGENGTTRVKPFDGYTCREAVKYLAQMYGKFATFGRTGALELRWYQESGFFTRKLYGEPEAAERAYQLKKVSCTVGESILTAGDGITGVSIENPAMTQEILDKVYAAIGGMEYLPVRCSFLGDIRLDLGDIITVGKRDGSEIKVPVMSLDLEFDGGVKTEIGSYGNTEAEESQPKGPVAEAMDRMFTKLLLVENLMASKVSTDFLEANYANVKQLEAVEARIDRIVATDITAEYLEAHYAQIDLSNVITQNVANLFVEVGLISDATIVNGHITGYLDSVSVNASSIKAGTLSVDRLVLNGTEESLIFALNNLGELTSTHCDTLDGGLITEKTITADHIVADTITAREIAAGTLTADVMDVKNVAAGIGKFVEIDAKQITSGKIDATMINATTLEAIVAKIGGFSIGSTYLANNTNALGTTANSVYLGTDGISCGTGFVAHGNGSCSIAGEITAKGGISMVGGIWNGMTTGSPTFDEDGITASFYAGSWRYSTSLIGGNAGRVLGIRFDNPIYSPILCTESLSIRGKSIYADADGQSTGGLAVDMKGHYEVLYFDDKSVAHFPGGISGYATSNHTHSYLPLAGGTMTGSITFANNKAILGTATMGSLCNLIRINSSDNIHIGGYGDYNTKSPVYLHAAGHQVDFVSGAVCPNVTNNVTLGTANKLWKAVYATALYEGTTALSSKYAAASHSHSYLPLAGGTLTGVLTANAGINTKSNIVSSVAQSTEFHISCNWKDGSAHNLVARNNDGLTAAFGWVGSASYKTISRIRGQTVQYQNSSGTTALSDARLKNSFKPLDEFDAVYMDIEPCAFRYNDGSSGRYHFGAKAQGVKAAFEKHGFTTKDFGGFVQMQDSPENEDYCGVDDPMGLIYTEFTMWNMHMAQKALQKIAELEAEVHRLEARITP